MTIQWSSYDGHLRVGIEVTFSPSSPTHADADVDMTLRVYVGCGPSWSYSDTQTMTLSGFSTASVSFADNLSANETMQVYAHTFTAQSISYAGGPTRTWTAAISGAFDGSAPSKTAGGTLPARPAGAPLAPGAPSFSSIASTSATVSWTAPSDEGSALTNRQVQLAVNSDFASVLIDSTATWGTSYGATGLPKGTTLYARVRAQNAIGWSSWSAAASFTTTTTVPGAPGTPTFSNIGGTSVDVAWTAPSDTGGTAITAYTVERATNSTFTTGLVSTGLPGSSLGLNVTGLTSATTYYVRVKATNAVGSSSYSSTASFTTIYTFPGAPTGVTAGSVAPASASVSWTAPASNGGSAITGYEVQFAYDSAFVNIVGTLSATASPKALSNLSPSTNYWVHVRAINLAGAGAWSSSTTFRTTSSLRTGNGTSWVDADVWIGNDSSFVRCRVYTGDGTVWK